MSETDSIDWEAATWIERQMDGEPFDQAAFDLWLSGDQRRRPAYERMWRRIMGSDMDAALKGYARRRVSAGTCAAIAIAAMLLLVGGYQAAPWVEHSLTDAQSYAVAEKRVRNIRLSDGTTIVLAGRAEIAVRYSQSQRMIELKRGALFVDVAPDPQRPFHVNSGEARITDIGTSFEVSRKVAGIQVTVASGVVHFGRNAWFSAPIKLTAGQSADLTQSGFGSIVDVPLDGVAPWRSEWVEYRGAPLGRVINDLQTLSPLPIEIVDKELAVKPTSGRIRLTDPVEQLQNLAIIYDFRVQRTSDALVITKQ